MQSDPTLNPRDSKNCSIRSLTVIPEGSTVQTRSESTKGKQKQKAIQGKSCMVCAIFVSVHQAGWGPATFLNIAFIKEHTKTRVLTPRSVTLGSWRLQVIIATDSPRTKPYPRSLNHHPPVPEIFGDVVRRRSFGGWALGDNLNPR